MWPSCFQFNNWINRVFGSVKSSGSTVPAPAVVYDTKEWGETAFLDAVASNGPIIQASYDVDNR